MPIKLRVIHLPIKKVIIFFSIFIFVLMLGCYISVTSYSIARTQSLSQYASPGLSFEYPSNFVLQEQHFESNEITHHVDFKQPDSNNHGFVEVWNLTTPLSTFLEKSKETSQQNYIYFKSTPVNVNKMDGFLWEYTVSINNKNYNGTELFLYRDEKMYRVSYFTPQESLQDSLKVFWTIANSLKV